MCGHRTCARGRVACWVVAALCTLTLAIVGPARRAWAEAASGKDVATQEQAGDAASAKKRGEGDGTSGKQAKKSGEKSADSSADKGTEQKRQITPAVQRKIKVTVRFIGLDGPWATMRRLELLEGASAWDATRTALTESELNYRTGAEATQDVIVSLTNADGTTLEADFANGSGWHLYLNGDRFQGSSSKVELNEGDKIEWRYEMGTIMVTVSVIGPGGTGDSYWVPPTGVRLDVSQNGWDASRTVFEQNGYSGRHSLSYTNGANGEVWLDALAALGENGITGESWQLFVNGSLSSTDIAHVDLHAGDSICWYYAGRGVASLPAFASRTGAAGQNPATAVSIEGVVGQTWVDPTTADVGGYRVLDRMAGLTLAGEAGASALVSEGYELMNPLAQSLGDVGWRSSLSHVLAGKLASGEGGGSLVGLDGGLFYLSDHKSVIRLDAR